MFDPHKIDLSPGLALDLILTLVAHLSRHSVRNRFITNIIGDRMVDTC
jgi:hypothetical protein